MHRGTAGLLLCASLSTIAAGLYGCASEPAGRDAADAPEVTASSESKGGESSCDLLAPADCSKQLDCKLLTFSPPTPPKCVQKTCEELQGTDADERALCEQRAQCKVVYSSPPTPPRCEARACTDLAATDSDERALCEQRADCRLVYSSPPTPPRCEAK